MSAKNEVKRGLEEEEEDMMETGREVTRRRYAAAAWRWLLSVLAWIGSPVCGLSAVRKSKYAAKTARASGLVMPGRVRSEYPAVVKSHEQKAEARLSIVRSFLFRTIPLSVRC